MAQGSEMSERETMQYDVITVGAGPAGLAFAIRPRIPFPFPVRPHVPFLLASHSARPADQARRRPITPAR